MMGGRRPMNKPRKTIAAPVLVIGVGVGWLLTVLEVFGTVDWVWPVSLTVGAILVIVFGGKNKFAFVFGPFLLISSLFSVLRQVGRLRLNLEIPFLVIILGLLWLVAELFRLPTPDWLRKEDEDEPGSQRPQGL